MNRKQRRKQSRSKTITRRAGVTYLTVAGVIGGTLGVAGPAYTAVVTSSTADDCDDLEAQLHAMATSGGSVVADFEATCNWGNFVAGTFKFDFAKSVSITGPASGGLIIDFTETAARGFRAKTPSDPDTENILTVSNLTFTQTADAIDKIDSFIGSESGAELVINNTKFINTDLEYSAIRAQGGEVSVTNSVFEDLTSQEVGTAIDLNGASSLTVAGSTFKDIVSVGHGGAIFGDSQDSLSIDSSSFINVTSGGNSGGAIYVDGGDLLAVSDSSFTDVAGNSGGSIYVEGTNVVTVIGTQFINSRATSNGGSLFIEGVSSFTVDDSTFTTNDSFVTEDGMTTGTTAGSGGGAIYSNQSGPLNTFTVTNSAFSNLMSSTGGAIRENGLAILSVSGSTFNNLAAVDGPGGAIYGEGNNGSFGVEGDLTVTDSTFSDLTSTDEGGAIFSEGSLTVYGSSFFENVSQTDGGAISSTSITSVTGSTFTENTSQTEGGAIRSLLAYIDNSTFVENSAPNGAAFSSMSEGSVISSNTFWNNGDINSSAIQAYDSEFFGNIMANTVGEVLTKPDGFNVPNHDLGANLYTDVSFEDETQVPLVLNGLSMASIADGSSKQVTLDELKLSTAALNTTNPVNTGKTKTVALLAGSVARDYYSSTSPGLYVDPGDLPYILPTVDQRGVDRAAGSRIDVGAYEAGEDPVVVPVETPVVVIQAPAAITKATIAKQTVKFAPGSSKLSSASKKTLRILATEIQAKGLKTINLEGYTATLTEAAPSGKVFRVKLSKARTAAVEKYLKEQFKKANYSVTFTKSSKGAANRVKSNKTEKGRIDNRRVEIAIN